MQVRRYKVFLKDYENKFNRTMLIKEDMNMKEVAVMILVCLGAEFESSFIIKDAEGCIYSSSKDSSYLDENINTISLGDNNSFSILYGNKDPYEFVVKVSKESISKSGSKVAFVEGGVGESLWENQRDLLIDYINGKDVDKKDKEEFDEKLNLSFYNQYLVYNFDAIINEIE